MYRLTAYLPLIFIALFVGSCQKEPDESILDDPQPANNCIITRAEIFDDTGALEDTAAYTFTNNLLSKITYTDFYNTFQYTGNKISRKNYYETGSVSVSAYDNVTYNGDGTVSKIETFYSDPSLPTPLMLFAYEFFWSAGKMIKMIEKVDTSFSGAPPISYLEYNYTYTGNNITRAIETDVFSNLKDTLDYVYDNTASHFSKNPNNFFTDLLFSEITGQLAPFAFSSNNIIAVKDSGGETAVGYNVDDKKNLKEFLVEGAVLIRYFYNCN